MSMPKIRNKTLNQFLIYFNRKKRYCFRESYYTRLQENYRDISSYYELAHAKSKNKRVTDRQISLSRSLKVDGITPKYITRKTGKPNYRISNNLSIGKVLILFYKIYLGDYKAKLELHFYKKKLFFYCYTFSDLKDEDKDKIIDLLKEKYLSHEKLQLNTKQDYIVDCRRNTITFHNDFDLSIKYVCNKDSEFFNILNGHAQYESITESRKTNKKINELYKNL